MISVIKKFFSINSVWRHVSILAGGSLVNRVLITMASPILTRLYTPADFGILSVFMSILTFMIVVSAFNYEAAIPLPEEDNSAYNLMWLSCSILAIISLGSVVVIFLSGTKLVVFFNVAGLEPYLWLLPISLIAGGIFAILNSWALRLKAFGSLAKRRLYQTVFQVITQISLPFFIQGPLGLLVGDSVGRSGGAIVLMREMRLYARRQDLQFSIPRMIQAAMEYKIFPTIGITSVILHSGFGCLPSLLISRLYGTREAGLYSLVGLVFAATSSIIGLSIAQVYMGHASQLALKSPLEMRTLFIKVSRVALVTGIIPFGLILLIGPFAFSFIFGGSWKEAGVYSQILALPYFIMFVVGPVYPTLKILGRQDLQLWADLLGLVILTLGMITVSFIGLNARWAVFIFGVAILVTYMLLYIFALKVIQNHCLKG